MLVCAMCAGGAFAHMHIFVFDRPSGHYIPSKELPRIFLGELSAHKPQHVFVSQLEQCCLTGDCVININMSGVQHSQSSKTVQANYAVISGDDHCVINVNTSSVQQAPTDPG
eukprot:gene8022-10062_t